MKKSVPLVMFALAALFIVALEATRDDGAFNRDTFRNSANLSSEEAVVVGGERSASLFLPSSYAQGEPVPLLLDLHGYGGEGLSHGTYTFMQAAADLRGMAYVAPNGLQDSAGSRFWNASSACCNFGASQISDVEYISDLIAEIASKVAIDTSRVYLFGHSNGHFMSYKFACSTKGLITAIAGLAGAMDIDLTQCAKNPINVLHIHGTNDSTILYEGGALLGNSYPSAQVSVEYWRQLNSCSASSEKQIDLLQSMTGDETSQIEYTCKKASVELWRINDGIHTPNLDQGFALRTIDWLLTHRK